VHRIFPNYVIRMWMTDSTGGLAAVLYGPSRVKAAVGAGKSPIEIQQETNYPFEEDIHFVIHAERPVSFPLSFRIPAWCTAPRFYLNERPIPQPPVVQGFARMNREFHPGDRITLTLPMKTALSHWPDNGAGIEHGPLVYSLPVKEEWTPVVEAKWSTPEFPEWNALPATPWNYGLATNGDKLGSEIRVQRKRMTDDPLLDPPISLVAPLRRIEAWELEADAKNANQKYTPPLPRITSTPDEPQRLALVPYGATHLRLTIFPEIK